MATEDLCIVCADSLDYTGFGPCGHKDACSRCVARLRFVLEDNKCMICKQANVHVYFTRYMGDYTERPEEYSQQYLMSRVQNGELHELPEVSGYFDDLNHYKHIKSLCSYTHPMMTGITFGTLVALKRKLQEQLKLHFCDLCIKGRKVFISEQVLYSKQDLEKHMRTGDDAGPMADSGFKGHPLCRFCRQRFYDGDELYKHMEGRHEHCFICRKLQPHKFVYYKDYAELEEHFQSQHHPCPHPACLERKFVVFPEEAELKRHFAAEHGADMNMSRAQRRQALSINIQLQYNQDQEAAAAAATLSRPGVVIGGGHNLPRRGGGMRHSRSDGAMAAALQASLESSQAESLMRQTAAEAAAPSSVTFSAEDFPTVSGTGMAGSTPLGTWVGASPSGPGSVALTHDDFPALPTMSRNQRRRQRERERNSAATLAGRLSVANAPIRVVNRAAAPAATSTAAVSAVPATAAGSSSSSRLVHHSSSTGNLASAAFTGLEDLQAADGDGDADNDAGFGPAAGVDDHFPALGGGSAGAPVGQAHPAWVPVRRGKPPKAGQMESSRSNSRAAVPSSVSDFPSLAAAMPASTSQAAGSKTAGSSRISKIGSKSSSSSSSSNGAGSTHTVTAAVAAAGGVSEQLKAANKALIDRIKSILSEEGFKKFREQSAGFIQGAMPAGDYHGHVLQLGLLSLVPQLAALCPDVHKRAALLAAHKQHIEAFASTAAAPASTKGWVPPEAAMAALQEAEEKGSWPCERCTLVNAPDSRACEVCAAPRPKVVAASSLSTAGTCDAAGSTRIPDGQQQQQQAQQSRQQQPPSQWSSAAAALASGLRQQAASRAESSAAALRPAAASPPPTTPASGGSWPSLAGPSSSTQNVTASSSGSSSTSVSAAGGAAAAAEAVSLEQQPPDSKGGKKKKGTKTSLQDLLASGRSHPQNAWSQQQRRQQVVTAPAGQQASMGSWKAGGGTKLAKKISAINDAWGE